MGRPNILLVTFDALRYDYLNKKDVKTPNLDSFAKENIKFTEAYATASWTAPSFKSIFTGQFPLENEGRLEIADKDQSFVSILQEEDYQTIGLPHHPYLCKFYGFQKGFDIFKDGIDFGNTSITEKIKRKILDTDTGNYLRMAKSIYTRHSCKKLKDIRKEFLNAVEERPFFGWLHSLDTHTPFTPPKKYQRVSRKRSFEVHKARYDVRQGKLDIDTFKEEHLEDLKELYKSEIEYIDAEFGKLLRELKEQDLYENTVIIVTADHGEEFLEHGHLHHQRYIYEELVHVPLLIKTSQGDKEERNEISSLINIGPTVLGLSNIDNSPNSLLQNSNNHAIMHAAEGDVLAGTNPQPQLSGEKKIGIRKKDYHYIHNFNKQDELYDLSQDREEQKNLITNRKIPPYISDILKDHKKALNEKITDGIDV
jgi:arylsulfatase A-like enzyme